MRTMAILIGLSLAFMTLVPLASYNASAAPEAQTLLANGLLSTDATFLLDYDTDPDAYDTAYLALNPYDGDTNHWDDTPGCVLWGNAMSPTVGSFGTAEVRYTVSDLVGEVSTYYTLTCDIWVSTVKDDPPASMTYPNTPTEALSFRVGFGYVDADSGTAEFINQTYHNRSSTAGTFAAFKEGIEKDDMENEFENRPFTRSEIDNLYVVLQIRFDPGAWGALNNVDDPPINSAIAYVDLIATPTDYTPEVQPTGSFILRPNADKYVNGFENQTVSDNEGMYGALNETNRHGDAEQSYINATWDKSAFVGLEFTDPPSWAADTDYKVTLWSIIRQTETGIGTYYTLTMSISSEGLDQKAYYPSTSYTNNTHDSDFIPGSSDYWRLTDLEDILANLWLGWVGATPSGELRVTQVAFLCTPIVPSDYVPDTGGFTDETFQEWITAGGFFTIFGFMGAVGLIAGAPLAIIFYKSGRSDGAGALAMAVGIIFVSLCFLLAGLSAYA